MKPTLSQFEAYQAMFDYFNAELFNNELPNIILNFSRKSKNVGGFFSPERWKGGEGVTHEISLNPDCWNKDVLHQVSVLVHEMVHLWQQEFGEVPRAAYHDKQWGKKMEEIGLMPSNTGMPGGKRTGQQMTHYVIEGGPFQLSYEAMPKEMLLPFLQIEKSTLAVKAKQKVKYTCGACDVNVWGKENLNIRCGDCGGEFEIAI